MPGVVGKLYYYDTKNHNTFERDKRNNILNTRDIVFDEKTKTVWTHGVTFGGEIVDNANDDSSTKVLSAGAGKRINDKVESLETDVEKLDKKVTGIKMFVQDLIGEEVIITEITAIKGQKGVKVTTTEANEKLIGLDIDEDSALGYNQDGKLWTEWTEYKK